MILLLFLLASKILIVTSEQPKLVLVRNGESEWKKKNLFEGWGDSTLSDKGKKEAIQGGKLLKEGGYTFDVCYTSLLKRSIHTAFHLLDELDQLHIPTVKSLNFNDRHYGALQGLNKKETEEKYGADQVNTWKRSYDIPPKALEEEDERNPLKQKKYKNYPKNLLPLHESLKDTNDRVISYFNETIIPDLKSGKNVLVIAHGDTLRAIIKVLDNLSEQEFIDLEIPNGIPLVYEFDNDLRPKKSYYLSYHDTINDKVKTFYYYKPNLKIIMAEKINKQQENAVWDILKRKDKDFVPPLSARDDSIEDIGYNQEKPEKTEKIGKIQEGPIGFFEDIKKDSFLFIIDNGKIEGFLSYKKDYPLEVDQGTIICDYITTILIDSHCRNKGYTKKMYNIILDERKDKHLATRTWSTNFAHVHIVGTLGFKLAHRIINDRGPNIDTVYFLKESEKN